VNKGKLWHHNCKIDAIMQLPHAVLG